MHEICRGAHANLFSHAVVLTSALNSKVIYHCSWNKINKNVLNPADVFKILQIDSLGTVQISGHSVEQTKPVETNAWMAPEVSG